jgi:acyl-coenzyme A thioesterase PaaI-like protein
LASLADVACGYAALSVMPADREVLTVVEGSREFQVAGQRRTCVPESGATLRHRP